MCQAEKYTGGYILRGFISYSSKFTFKIYICGGVCQVDIYDLYLYYQRSVSFEKVSENTEIV